MNKIGVAVLHTRPPHVQAPTCFIFFFGIIAFNSGANLSISNANDVVIVSRPVINTIISVAASTTMALTNQRFVTSSGRLRKNWSFMNAINGSYVGMVLNIVIVLNEPCSFRFFFF